MLSDPGRIRATQAHHPTPVSRSLRRPPSGPLPPRRRLGAGVHPAVLTRRLAAGARRRPPPPPAPLAPGPLGIGGVLLWGGGQAALALMDDPLGAIPAPRRLPADTV